MKNTGILASIQQCEKRIEIEIKSYDWEGTRYWSWFWGDHEIGPGRRCALDHLVDERDAIRAVLVAGAQVWQCRGFLMLSNFDSLKGGEK